MSSAPSTDRPGTIDRPLRVAVVGSGPAGFYTVQHLFQATQLTVGIDMYDRLPTPFGLVRHGVAPDHQKIKNVIAVYEKLAARETFRFYGGVEFGRDVGLADLCRHYHQVVFTTGAQTDRPLGIPGERLAGSHAATEFVAWYNGHPDYRDCVFDLSCASAIVVGAGNVAVDVARILCRTPEELAATDIADHALQVLRESRVRCVHVLGRRGPAQAAFTTPEIKELGELPDACAVTHGAEVELDPLTRAQIEVEQDKLTRRKIEILQSFAGRSEPAKSRQLILRFLVSPLEILGDEKGRVKAMRVAHNELYAAGDNDIRAKSTERTELIEAGLVFRAVGYQGVRLPDLPFDERRCVIPNEKGRILDGPGGEALPGLYVSGWIKRGPTGVIGTNKPDAGETVVAMLEDLAAGRFLAAPEPEPEAVERQLAARGRRFVSYADWRRLDALETSAGAPLGRPRVKFTRLSEFFEALD